MFKVQQSWFWSISVEYNIFDKKESLEKETLLYMKLITLNEYKL